MPKKGKKADGKMAGKTEEEKLLFLQQRAMAEEEMARKKEEILTLFLKDKLQKEERNSSVNLLKINDGWRFLLRQTRAADLREEITILSQTFERQLDALDRVIKNLDSDLQEAERQASHVKRVHLFHLERLWTHQDQRMGFIQSQWEEGLRHLYTRFNSDRKQSVTFSQQQKSDLKDASFSVAQKHRAIMNYIHTLYGETVAAYESAHEDRKAALVLKSREKLREKTFQNQESLSLCHKESKKLNDLQGRNTASIQLSKFDVKKVKALQDSVIQLRAKLISSKLENQLVEEEKDKERGSVNRKTHLFRAQLTAAHREAQRQLRELTVTSEGANKKLQTVIHKGEKVLRIAEMCHKMETEQKIFTVTLLLKEEERGGDKKKDTAGDPSSPLYQVTRRINSAVLQREALKKHKDDLHRENNQLKLMLRQHLDGMTLTDTHLESGGRDRSKNNNKRPLLAVKKAPTFDKETSGRPLTRYAVIEAVHAAKHQL